MIRVVIGLLLLAAALSAAAQTHIVQPFKFLWDYADTADRFEFKLDTGGYVNVGLPPLVAGSFAMQADPTMTGAHSAVVRACLLAVCTGDSNTLAFVVDQGPPGAVRLAVGVPPTPPVLTESSNFTKATAPGVGSIVDAKLLTWTLGPKDPAIEGGVEYTILHGGTREGGAATYLCYFGHLVYAWSVGNWYQQTALNGFQFSPIVPVGC